MGGYRCACPQGYVQHMYYSQCIDENECMQGPCGSANCQNTLGSYSCSCPPGYQFDGQLLVCVQVLDSQLALLWLEFNRRYRTLFLFLFLFQVSSGCSNSPCAFGCYPMGNSGFSCGCPGGYQRIAQVLLPLFWILFVCLFVCLCVFVLVSILWTSRIF